MTITITLQKEDGYILIPTLGFKWNKEPKKLEIMIAFLNSIIQIEIY